MTRTVEGVRIFRGVSAAEKHGPLRLLVGHTDARSTVALQRCKDVLVAVTHWIPPRGEPVTVADWVAHTPAWFVDACGPDDSEVLEPFARAAPPIQEEADQTKHAWSFAEWIAWFDWTSGLRRPWRWWDGGIGDDDRFWIRVEVTDPKASLASLVWMMTAAGAVWVEERPLHEAADGHAEPNI